MEERSGTNCSQRRWEAVSLQKGKRRILCITDTQNHWANWRASFLPPVRAEGSSSSVTPARPRGPSPKTVLTQQKKAQNTPPPNTRSNFQELCFWFGPPQLYLCYLLMTCKPVNTWHLSPNSMKSKSSTSVLVVVPYCLLKTEEELNDFPMHLNKKQKNNKTNKQKTNKQKEKSCSSVCPLGN